MSLGWLRQEIQMLTPGRLASEYLASHIETAAPLTLESLRLAYEEMTARQDITCACPLCQPPPAADNVTDELMALVRQGDEARFRELAGCVMPAEEVNECWAGARGRLGLASLPLGSDER